MIAQTLKTDIEAYGHRMLQSALMRRARDGELPGAAVATYLSSILYLIRHTPVYLELARERAAALGEHDLARYFASKMREEAGHDQWAQNDVASVERSFDVAAPSAPLPSIAALVAYLRRTIEDDPERYLAYILFAEHFTVLTGPQWLAAMESRCGVPASSMTVVAHHVELDRRHVAEGLAEIDELVRDPARLVPLRDTLHASMRFFTGFCDELAELGQRPT